MSIEDVENPLRDFRNCVFLFKVKYYYSPRESQFERGANPSLARVLVLALFSRALCGHTLHYLASKYMSKQKLACVLIQFLKTTLVGSSLNLISFFIHAMLPAAKVYLKYLMKYLTFSWDTFFTGNTAQITPEAV